VVAGSPAEGRPERGRVRCRQPYLLETRYSLEDGSPATFVKLGHDVVEEDDGRIRCVVAQDAGFGEPQGEGCGADLGARAVGGGEFAVDIDTDLVTVRTGERDAGSNVATPPTEDGSGEETPNIGNVVASVRVEHPAPLIAKSRVVGKRQRLGGATA